jgi:hypothetical protein
MNPLYPTPRNYASSHAGHLAPEPVPTWLRCLSFLHNSHAKGGKS